MTDHASAFRVAAPFLSVTAIPHLTHRIGGTAASARVQSTVLRILFGSIVLIGSLIISSTTDPQGWSASREPLFLLAGMLFLASVPLVAAGAAWMTLRQSKYGGSLRASDMRCHGTAADLLYWVSDQSGTSCAASQHRHLSSCLRIGNSGSSAHRHDVPVPDPCGLQCLQLLDSFLGRGIGGQRLRAVADQVA